MVVCRAMARSIHATPWLDRLMPCHVVPLQEQLLRERAEDKQHIDALEHELAMMREVAPMLTILSS